jgi:hypothetical protein
MDVLQYGPRLRDAITEYEVLKGKREDIRITVQGDVAECSLDRGLDLHALPSENTRTVCYVTGIVAATGFWLRYTG